MNERFVVYWRLAVRDEREIRGVLASGCDLQAVIGRVSGHADSAETTHRRKGSQALRESLRVHLSNLRRRREWYSIVGKIQRQMHAARARVVGFQDQAAR